MRIAVLTASDEAGASPFTPYDPVPDPARYLPDHACVAVRVAKATAVRQVAEVARGGFDAVINLCDGAWDEARAGVEVVQALERLGVAFTGAGSACYDPSREAMKLACAAAGVAFPAYVLATDAAGLAEAARALRFPLLVKPPAGYSSVGITPASRVADAAALRRQGARVLAEFGAALVEEFVEGREYTVLVAEPRDGVRELAWALAPVECRFPPGESFKHFDLKWKDYARLAVAPVDDARLAARLRAAAARVFAALEMTGYGRCDVRVDAAGTPFLLEVNPNCAVFYPDGAFGSADEILARDPAGPRGFLDHLLACAARRRDRARPAARLAHDRRRGFALVAARPLGAGEVAEPYAGRLRAAVPGAAGEWRPLRHAADPSCAVGLGGDLVTRRPVAAGEPLTVDRALVPGLVLPPARP